MPEEPKKDRWSNLADLFGLASSSSPPPAPAEEPPPREEPVAETPPEPPVEEIGWKTLEATQPVPPAIPTPAPVAAAKPRGRWASIASALGIGGAEEAATPAEPPAPPPPRQPAPPPRQPVAPPTPAASRPERTPRQAEPPPRSRDAGPNRPKRGFAADFMGEEEPEDFAPRAEARNESFPPARDFDETPPPPAPRADGDEEDEFGEPRRLESELTGEPRRRRRRRRGRRSEGSTEGTETPRQEIEEDVTHDDVVPRHREEEYDIEDTYTPPPRSERVVDDLDLDEEDLDIRPARRDEADAEERGPRKRRRRRRGSGSRDREQTSETGSAPPRERERERPADGPPRRRPPREDVEMEADAEDVGDEGLVADHAHRSFPTWLETVDVMINSNIAQRDARGGSRGGGHRGSRGGGRGRGGR